jgi:hypothetical protein
MIDKKKGEDRAIRAIKKEKKQRSLEERKKKRKYYTEKLKDQEIFGCCYIIQKTRYWLPSFFFE